MATTSVSLAATDLTTHVNTLLHYVRRHAAERGEQVYLIGPENNAQLTYRELAQLAGELAQWFDEQGIQPGQAVAMLLPNGVAVSSLFVAITATGRVVVPLSLLAQKSHLQHALEHSDAQLVITTKALAENLDSATSLPPTLQIDPDDLTHAPWRSADRRELGELSVTPENHALLMYTSGTTGQPKGVDLTHANLVFAAHTLTQWHGLGQVDRVLSSLPLYHINGQVVATLTPLVSGGSVVAPRQFSVREWWSLATRFDVTWLNMVPTIIAYLLNHTDELTGTHRIRFARSASAPLSPEHHRAFEERFRIPVIEGMGMTESASVVFCNPMPPALRKVGSPGVPVAVDARIVDGRGQVLADDTPGEIQLRGNNVMAGYHQAPERTAEATTDDGWLRTGDLGFRDADGYYFITGRLKEIIIKGGENIAPREIDEVLLAHPAVLEAAAVGIADDNYGEDILAAVVLKEGHTVSEQELRAHCEATLGRFKSPKTFTFLHELPKGPSGKVQRLKIKAYDRE